MCGKCLRDAIIKATSANLGTRVEYPEDVARMRRSRPHPFRAIFFCVQCRGQTTATDRVDYIIPEKTVPHRQRRQRHLSNYGHQMSAITRPSPPFLLSLLWVTDRPRFLFPPARGV